LVKFINIPVKNLCKRTLPSKNYSSVTREDEAVVIRCRREGGYVEKSELVHIPHNCTLSLPVFPTVLHDTETINPDIFKINLGANGDYVPKCEWKVVDREGGCPFGEGFLSENTTCSAAERRGRIRWRTPAMGEGEVWQLFRVGGGEVCKIGLQHKTSSNCSVFFELDLDKAVWKPCFRLTEWSITSKYSAAFRMICCTFLGP
jgi:hypothetical protein